MKKPIPSRRTWRFWLVVGTLAVAGVAINASLWAYFYLRGGHLTRPVVKPSPGHTVQSVPLIAGIVTDLKAPGQPKHRLSSYPLRMDPNQPFRTRRVTTEPGKDAHYHVRLEFDDGKACEFVIDGPETSPILVCGDYMNEADQKLIDFLDSAWSMDILHQLASYDPDEFRQGLARREEAGDKLTLELCDQLGKPETFGGHTVWQLRLLLEPTPGSVGGPPLFDFDPTSDRRAALIRERLLNYLRTCHSEARKREGGHFDQEHGAACDLLYRLVTAEDRPELRRILASSTGPNQRIFELLQLHWRLASHPDTYRPRYSCPTGETAERMAAFGKAEHERTLLAVKDWLAEEVRLDRMAPEARLEHLVQKWDELLEERKDFHFLGGSNNWLRPKAWSRIVALGQPVVPLAKDRFDHTADPIDEAFWHAVLVHFRAAEVDHRLVARLLEGGRRRNDGDQADRIMARLILTAAETTDIEVKYPELRYIESIYSIGGR
jgi:hypothetical protein